MHGNSPRNTAEKPDSPDIVVSAWSIGALYYYNKTFVGFRGRGLHVRAAIVFACNYGVNAAKTYGLLDSLVSHNRMRLNGGVRSHTRGNSSGDGLIYVVLGIASFSRPRGDVYIPSGGDNLIGLVKLN